MIRNAALLISVLGVAACSSSSDAGDDGTGSGGGTDAGAGADGAPTGSDGGTSEGGTTPDGGPAGTRPSTLGGASVPGSTGCGTTGATGVQSVSLTVGGATRTGTISVPADYDASKAYPIVFVFHGDGGTGAQIRTGMNVEGAAGNKAIFAYPDGAGQTWDSDLTASNQDMALVLAMRDSVRSSYCVDTTRTFATGMSRGAYFTNQLACMYGVSTFTAIAPHSGTISAAADADYVYGPPKANGGPYTEGGNYDFRCPVDPTGGAVPILPPPALVIHGECDTEGGVEFAEGRNTVEHWGYAAQCSTTPAVVVETSPNPTCSTGSLTSSPTLAKDPCYVAPGCKAGHDVTFCAIPSMGHQVWSEAPARIWAFFAAH